MYWEASLIHMKIWRSEGLYGWGLSEILNMKSNTKINPWGLLRSFFDSYENLRIQGLIWMHEPLRDLKHEVKFKDQFMRFTEKLLLFKWKFWVSEGLFKWMRICGGFSGHFRPLNIKSIFKISLWGLQRSFFDSNENPGNPRAYLDEPWCS